MIKSKFKQLCPVCGKDVYSNELYEFGKCIDCFNNERLSYFEQLEKRLVDLKKTFNEKYGFSISKIQRTWLKRYLEGESFAMIAATGVGKTTTGLFFTAICKGKAHIIVPTKILAQQLEEKIRKITDKKIIRYEKTKDKEEIKKFEWDILITTAQFIVKNHELLKGKIDFVFIDDIDSVFRNSRVINYILYELGYTQEEIDSDNPPRKGQIVLSSATANFHVANVLVKVFGIDVSSTRNWSFRNIYDTKIVLDEFEDRKKFIKDLVDNIDGIGIVLTGFGDKESLDELKKILKELKIKHLDFTLDKKPDFSQIDPKKVKLLLGVAHSRNSLVRGLDLPGIVKFILFYGAPVFKIPLNFSIANINYLSYLVNIVSRYRRLPSWWKTRLSRFANKSLDEIKEDKYIQGIYDYLTKLLMDEEFLEQIKQDIQIIKKGEKLFLVSPDITTYLQATGRLSRLTKDGLTSGLSIVLLRSDDSLQKFEKKLSYFIEDFKFDEFSFEKVKEFLNKPLKVSKEPKTALLIVESPTKARTIANFFGKPALRRINNINVYEVNAAELTLMITSSTGHILDLSITDGVWGVEESKEDKWIPIFKVIRQCPKCGEVLEENYCDKCKIKVEGKKTIIEALQKIAWESNEVYLVTDPDTEGEKISWDIYSLLKPFSKNLQRLKFYEITRGQIIRKLKEPENLNEQLVKAQLLRRISDRWVGFSLSQQLWKQFSKNWLSAGRVQTPVLGWIIKRHEEAQEKDLLLNIDLEEGINFTIKILDAKKLNYRKLNKVKVKLLKEEEKQVNPLPPYTTSTLIEDANRILKFSATKTMQVAQSLFELGLITYHRTDSIRISQNGQNIAKRYLTEKGMDNLYKPRSWSDTGAHEAIRPTKPMDINDLKEAIRLQVYKKIDSAMIGLYNLIFKRFIASQMREETIIYSTFEIDIVTPKVEIKQELEGFTKIKEEAFSKVWSSVNILKLKEGVWENVKFKKTYVPKKPLFTQGALIQEMKNKGLGRPSTYANIIKTLIDKGYVKEWNQRLVPTKEGIEVYQWLRKNFPEWTDDEFTVQLEKRMQEVENGEKDFREELDFVFNKLVKEFFSSSNETTNKLRERENEV